MKVSVVRELPTKLGIEFDRKFWVFVLLSMHFTECGFVVGRITRAVNEPEPVCICPTCADNP